jgi:molybdopterin synthase catalytic subunit
MKIHVELTREKIVRPEPDTAGGAIGAWVEFAGVVRGEEAGQAIAALEYEAYDSMAERVMRELLDELGRRHKCNSAHAIHRVGIIRVGETAIWIGVGSGHRQEALALVAGFMDRLKQDVPFWKRRAWSAEEMEDRSR